MPEDRKVPPPKTNDAVSKQIAAQDKPDRSTIQQTVDKIYRKRD